MPFVKRGEYYVSPSGKKFTKEQVKLYHATKGFKPSLMKRLKSHSSK